VIGPQASITSASAAWAEWNPSARRVMSRTLLLSASTLALLIPSRMAARMPSRCLWIVAARVTNASRRLRLALTHQRSSSSVLSLGEVTGEDLAQALLERLGAPCRAAVAAQLAQRGGLVVGQSLGSLEQHPACPLELVGLVGVDGAQLVPDLPAEGVERVGGQGQHMERVDAHSRLRRVARLGDRLQIRGAHVGGDGGELGGSLLAELGEEPVAGGGVLAFGAPSHLAAAMIGDQGEGAVLLAPGHLVDPDLEQRIQPARVELVGDHPSADRPDRLPGDPHQPADRGLVHPGGQPRHQVLEVAGAARLDPSERDLLGADPVLGAVDPAQFGLDDQPQAAKVQVPPAGVDPAGVIAGLLEWEQSAQASRRRPSATVTVICAGSNQTSPTVVPGRASKRLNAAVTRTGVGPPGWGLSTYNLTVRPVRVTHPKPNTSFLPSDQHLQASRTPRSPIFSPGAPV